MNYFILIFSLAFCCLTRAQGKTADDSCKLSIAGKTNGNIALSVLKKQKGLLYSDTLNCDYRLKDVEFIIKDKMGTDIISQTTPVFLDDMKKAIEKMEAGTKITITTNIWTDKKHSGICTQVMKLVVN